MAIAAAGAELPDMRSWEFSQAERRLAGLFSAELGKPMGYAFPTLLQVALLIEHEDELASASNAVIELLDADEVDEAEQAARELLVRFPDVHDGYDRLGMVYEARGDRKAAADCYRKVIEFARAHPELYDPEFEITFQRLIVTLDPPPDAAG